MDNKIFETILKRKKEKTKLVKTLSQCSLGDAECLINGFEKYISNRFLISIEDLKKERNIIELAKIAISKSENLGLDNINYKDVKDCSGTTSSMTRKILLIIAIEKDFNIKFTDKESSEIETIEDLVKVFSLKRSNDVV